MSTNITPVMDETEARAHASFTALMWALSYPGRAATLPGGGRAAFSAIADALLDLETSAYTDDDALRPLLARSGAALRPPAAALYQFYPRLDEAAIVALGAAPVGTYLYPDQSATLIIGCTLGAGRTMTWRGPGISDAAGVLLGDVPEAFWPLREQTIRYPFGWDVLFVAGAQVVGLPRTTIVEVKG